MYEEIEVPITFPVNLEEKMVLTQNFMLPITKKKIKDKLLCVQVFLIKFFRKFFCLYIYPHYIKLGPIQEACYKKIFLYK